MKTHAHKYVIAMVVTLFLTSAYAATPSDPMTGPMDVTQMAHMMRQCNSMQSDRKVCDYKIMGACLQQMEKSECKKMMSQAKRNNKSKSVNK